MRQRFEAEPGLNLTLIEQIVIPLHSRDELPPILVLGVVRLGLDANYDRARAYAVAHVCPRPCLPRAERRGVTPSSRLRPPRRTILDTAARSHVPPPDGFNLGVNDGTAAGQTIAQFHLHIIPRYVGDVPDPRGGLRWVIPPKARYW